MKRLHLLELLIILSIASNGCELFAEKTIIDEGKNIRLVFEEALHEYNRIKLPKDANGFDYMTLMKQGQNIQRISVRLLDGDKIVYSKCCGRRHGIRWSSNLFWWIMEGDKVANITKTYFNPFTGELQYVNLPPLINWKDEIVPTVNASSVTDEYTGKTSTVIAPIGPMKGDTLTVYVRYWHEITKWMEREFIILYLKWI